MRRRQGRGEDRGPGEGPRRGRKGGPIQKEMSYSKRVRCVSHASEPVFESSDDEQGVVGAPIKITNKLTTL